MEKQIQFRQLYQRSLKRVNSWKIANAKIAVLRNHVHTKLMSFRAQTFVTVNDIMKTDMSNPTHFQFQGCVLFVDSYIDQALCLFWLLKQKYSKRCLLRPNPISVILRMDVPLNRKTSVSAFTGKLRVAASWRNINSHRVCKNQEIVRFLENIQEAV